MYGSTCSDDVICPTFAEPYLSSLKFHWPFSDEGIFTSGNDENNTPRLSGLFEKYVRDIENWSIAEGFFSLYGDLRPLFSPDFIDMGGFYSF